MNVYKFYNSEGWQKKDNKFKDANLFEDNRTSSQNYVSECRKRILKYIPKKGENILDFASGPIQYKEYLEYSKNFKYRHCVDFSKKAIEEAKKKLGKKGKYYCKDFLKLKFKKNTFDCILSMHTIYHINKNQQRKVILKMIDIVKKNKPIIIVYSNPDTIINRIKNIFKRKKRKQQIYFYCFKNEWWYQFSKKADIKFYPWRSFSSQHQQLLFPNNFIGSFFFKILFFLENKFNKFFVKYFQYQIIIIKKR